MAVGALYPMDVVRAGWNEIGGVHFLNVKLLSARAAVGHFWMTGFAGGARVLIVAGVTGDATDALMNANGSAVVAGAELGTPAAGFCDGARLRPARRVALIADGGAEIGAYGHEARAIVQFGDGQRGRGEVHLLAAVEECEGIVDGVFRD